MAQIMDIDKRVAQNLRLVMDMRDLTNDDIAAEIGRPTKSGRNWVQERTSGRQPCTNGQTHLLADAVKVPVRVLQGEPEHVMRYLTDHPDLVAARFGCIIPTPLEAAWVSAA